MLSLADMATVHKGSILTRHRTVTVMNECRSINFQVNAAWLSAYMYFTVGLMDKMLLNISENRTFYVDLCYKKYALPSRPQEIRNLLSTAILYGFVLLHDSETKNSGCCCGDSSTLRCTGMRYRYAGMAIRHFPKKLRYVGTLVYI